MAEGRDSVGALARLIRRRRPCVVLTGAGISTESGIPDFRSPTGLWARFDPLEYASLEAFQRDPRKVWSFYKPRIAMLTGAAPNPAHLALAELERLGFVQAVVTQNIDLLHERAGSREVVEVHGSIRTASCPGCGARCPLEQVLELLAERDAPACPSCGEILKPDVVFFGELLPPAAIERAYELARGAGLRAGRAANRRRGRRGALGDGLGARPTAAGGTGEPSVSGGRGRGSSARRRAGA